MGFQKTAKKYFLQKEIQFFFDARKNPHYVEPLKSEKGIRIAITMNFYTLNSPEENRPKDLNEHLFKVK